MSFVVEDGTGKTDADAFISVQFFKAYCDARGHDYSAHSDTDIEQAIVRSTAFMSDSFAWAGYRVKGRGSAGGAQALSWPRGYVTDGDGYPVPNDAVPDEVERATAEVTRRELDNPGAMTPDYTPSERVRRERVGPLETEYDVSRKDADSVRPVLLIVRDLIGPLLASNRGSRIVGGSVRV